MRPTVNSIMRIRDEIEENVLATLEKFKAVQDIPVAGLDVQYIDSQEIELTLEYSLDVFDKTVTNFLAVLYGELPYMKGFGSLRFVGLDVPDEVYSWFNGPQFGIDGIKPRFHCQHFPFLMSVIKPSVDPMIDREGQVSKLTGPLEAGFHAVKDDEMLGSLSRLSLWDRVELAAQNPGYIPAVNLDRLADFTPVFTNG